MVNYILELEPKPAPRPRARVIKVKGKYTATVYNPADYTNYKNTLILLIKGLKVPAGDYVTLNVTFYFSYPKSTPKKNLIEGAPHCKKPDGDNLSKGLQDALEQAEVIKNDSQLANINISKKYTLENPRIEFNLS